MSVGKLLEITKGALNHKDTIKELNECKARLEQETAEHKELVQYLQSKERKSSDKNYELRIELERCESQIQILESNCQFFQDTIKLLESEEKPLNSSAILPEDEIIYLTGMSINKKTFHNVYELMSKDEDLQSAFKFLINKIQRIDKNSLEEDSQGSLLKISQELGKDVIKNMLLMGAVSVAGGYPVAVSLACTLLVSLYSMVSNDELEESLKSINLSLFAKELQKEIERDKGGIIKSLEELNWSKFFAIYQSNQSDIRGISSISSEGELRNRFVLHYGYSDKPFYENLFVNSITIGCTGRLLDKICSTDLENLYERVYQEHISDIILSRVLQKNIINILKKDKDKDKEKDKKGSKGIADFISDDAIKVFKDSLESRNLFGIDLISRFLFILIAQLKDEDKLEGRLKVFVDTDFITSDYIKEKFKLEKLKEEELKEEVNRRLEIERARIEAYTKELWEYGSSPVYFEFSTKKDESDLIISMQYLDNNNFYPSYEYIDSKVKNNPNSFSLKIPIKIFVSLPIKLNDKGEQIPTREIFVPERLVHNAKDDGTMNIYTVGGIEHNRPLMRLVNIHRQQKGRNRILGFFDNRFDFVHKFDHKGERDFIHYFLMGANQPVSGLNAYHYSRFDDATGNSISTDAKIIYFNLVEESSKFNNGKKLNYHIVSVYGFSALASAYATLWTIINIKESINKINNELGYRSSLAFKALDISDRNQMKDTISVFTKRVKFLPTNEMENKLKDICHGLEPFSYLRLEYLKPKENRELVKFMYGKPETNTDNPIRADAVIDIEDGLSRTKQENNGE